MPKILRRRKDSRITMREPMAREMFINGSTLTQIAEALDISTNTISRWKRSTYNTNTKIDEWELARRQKKLNIHRLRYVFERHLSYIEGLKPDEISSADVDVLSKMGSLVERWESIEAAFVQLLKKQAASVSEDEKSPNNETNKGLSADTVETIRKQVLGIR